MIRIVIADDQQLIREALRTLLELHDDLTVVGLASDGFEALTLVEEEQPDVLLLDLEMPRSSGFDVLEKLAQGHRSTKSLIITTFSRPGYLQRALENDARGFIVKDTPAEKLAQHIRAVHAGEKVIDPHLAAQSCIVGNNPLTSREQEVLSVAHRGDSIQAIAAIVHLSEGTTRNHLSSAIAKLGAANRHQASQMAQERGWITTHYT
ncbi:response regulator transcription factor [Rothia sp. P6271]|uniref:response regulator transcription factor n=1 Tax=Rothia sp. P6271 TaxID=3402659 RepID=UPI003AC25AE1